MGIVDGDLATPDEATLDEAYLASLYRNQRFGLGRTIPRQADPGTGTDATWGDVGRGASGLLQEVFSPGGLATRQGTASVGLNVPEGARVVQTDMFPSGWAFQMPDGSIRDARDPEFARHGGLFDLADLLPMAGVGGGPQGTIGAGASRGRAVAAAAADPEAAAAVAPGRRAGEARVPSVRAEERLAAPTVSLSEARDAARRVDQQDQWMLDYLQRPEREPPPRVLPPSGEDTLRLGQFDLTQVPDVPQTPMWRVDPSEGRRRGVPGRMIDLTSNPDVERQYRALVEHGRDNLQGREWYNMDPLRFRFIEVLGPEEGERAFRNFTQNIAATSPRSNIIDNMRNASHYYVQEATGEPLARRQPAPYGHLAQNLHRSNVETIRSPEGWNLETNPKPPSFAENLAGNQYPGTMDAHALSVPAILSRDPRFLGTSLRVEAPRPPRVRGEPAPPKEYRNLSPQGSFNRGVFDMDTAQRFPTLWENVPRPTEYGALEDWFRRMGNDLGMTTAQTQASGWVGGGKVSGLRSPPLPAAEIFQRVLWRNAVEQGRSPDAVLLDMIMRERALRAQGPDAAGLAARGLLGDDNER